VSKRILQALSVALLLLSLSAGSVLAGEQTGKGEPTAGPANANSICVFSGQNDDPTGIDVEANGPPGRTQSFGQEVRLGFIDPTQFNPGFACRGGSNFARVEK
jgi:hypothetical protein